MTNKRKPPAPPRPDAGNAAGSAPPASAQVAATRQSAEWIVWVAEQYLRGCTPESMLPVMTAGGLGREESASVIELVPSHPLFLAAQRQQQLLRKLESTAANLQLLWELDPTFGTVDKRAVVSEDEFIHRYVRGCRPVVLTGHTQDWPAMQRWSPADLKARFGHLEVEIQAERKANPRYEEDKMAHSRIVRLGDFVEQVMLGGETNDYYLTANNEALRRPELAPLLDDIGSLPPCCNRAELAERSSFWFGPAGTVTPLHHEFVRPEHFETLAARLLEVPNEARQNENLFSFLNRRTPLSFLKRLLELEPKLIRRRGRSSNWYKVSWHAEYLMHARAHYLRLLPEEIRTRSCLELEQAALQKLDISFIPEEGVLSLFKPHELIALTLKIGDLLRNSVSEEITTIEENLDFLQNQ